MQSRAKTGNCWPTVWLSGGDWRTWKVRDVDSGKDLDDLVQWVKFSNIAWMPDAAVFYGRYAELQEGQELTGTNETNGCSFIE